MQNPHIFVFLLFTVGQMNLKTVGCTLSAMDFVCIMSAYHCCVRIQVGFLCFSIFVCVSCACIDWTVERQVSVVIVSGIFFSRARRMQMFILSFSTAFCIYFWELSSQTGSVFPSMIV